MSPELNEIINTIKAPLRETDILQKLCYLVERCDDLKRTIKETAQDYVSDEFSGSTYLEDNLDEAEFLASLMVAVIKDMRVKCLN